MSSSVNLLVGDEMLDRIKSIPANKRKMLPGQVKSKIITMLTGRKAPQVYSWEDPLDAAESLAPIRKIKEADANKAKAEQWLKAWVNQSGTIWWMFLQQQCLTATV